MEYKLWNSHLFREKGVQSMESYHHQTISLYDLQCLLEFSLQQKFATKEVVALVQELGCTSRYLGDIIINYTKVLTNLKQFGNSFTPLLGVFDETC